MTQMTSAKIPAAVATILQKHGFVEKFYPEQGIAEPFYSKTMKLAVNRLYGELNHDIYDGRADIVVEVTPAMKVQAAIADTDFLLVVDLSYDKDKGMLDGGADKLLLDSGVPEHAVTLLALSLLESKGKKLPTHGKLRESTFMVTKFGEPSGDLTGTAVLLHEQKLKSKNKTKTSQLVHVYGIVDAPSKHTIEFPKGLTYMQVQDLAKDLEFFEHLIPYFFD